MKPSSRIALRAAALCMSLGLSVAVPATVSAATIQVDVSSQFFGQIEFPNSVGPILSNPVGTGSMSIDSGTSLASGSALISAGAGSYSLPNAVVLGVTDGGSDGLTVRWFLIDGNNDYFHLTVDFADSTGLGVVGTTLTSNVAGWTFSSAFLDRGSDNTCCSFNPMSTSQSLNAQVSVVPEPTALALLGLGLAGLGFGRRKKA